ncbi:MAG: 3-dehydroquinate synthase family protein [Bacteriovoracaceae bacterium]
MLTYLDLAKLNHSVALGRKLEQLFYSDMISKHSKGEFTKLIFVVDSNVMKKVKKYLIYFKTSKIIPFDVLTLNVNESIKNVKELESYIYLLKKMGTDRKSLMVIFGGGILSDTFGFIASIFMRGIPWIVFPTSLLSMVDSSVGGKVAMNVGQIKNYIGVINLPQAIYCDLDFLKSLSKNDYTAGLSEVYKYAMINDETLLQFMHKNWDKILKRDPFLLKIIERSVFTKYDFIKDDLLEKESGKRRFLNFGHTFGHALESITHHKISHGHAIWWGILFMIHIFYQKSVISENEFMLFLNFYERVPLANFKIKLDPKKIYEIMQSDKKSANAKIRFVAIKKIGQIDMKWQEYSDKLIYDSVAFINKYQKERFS